MSSPSLTAYFILGLLLIGAFAALVVGMRRHRLRIAQGLVEQPAAEESALLFGRSFNANTFVEGQFGVAGTTAVPGDYNGDGVLDAADYIMVKTHFGGAPAAGTEGTGGDFNENGTVDWEDLQTLMTGFSEAADAGTPVPEPTTLLIALAASLPALLKRRRS